MALSDEQIDRVLEVAPRVPPMYVGWVADQRRFSARAIEAEVRKDDTELIRQLVEALEKADKISGYPNNRKTIAAGRARLEEGGQ